MIELCANIIILCVLWCIRVLDAIAVTILLKRHVAIEEKPTLADGGTRSQPFARCVFPCGDSVVLILCPSVRMPCDPLSACVDIMSSGSVPSRTFEATSLSRTSSAWIKADGDTTHLDQRRPFRLLRIKQHWQHGLVPPYFANRRTQTLVQERFPRTPGQAANSWCADCRHTTSAQRMNAPPRIPSSTLGLECHIADYKPT